MEVEKIIAVILAWIQIVSGAPTPEKDFGAEEEAAEAEDGISKKKTSKKMAASMDNEGQLTRRQQIQTCQTSDDEFWKNKVCRGDHHIYCENPRHGNGQCMRSCHQDEDGCPKKFWASKLTSCAVSIKKCGNKLGDCYAAGFGKCDDAEKSFKTGDSSTPCPHNFDGQYCDMKTARSFGCWRNYCWRSCEVGDCPEKDESYKWCYAPTGYCSYSSNCIVATTLPCDLGNGKFEGSDGKRPKNFGNIRADRLW